MTLMPEQARVVERVARLTRERIAPRAFRDVGTATLMPPTIDRMLEAIGKRALGLQEGMFRIASGPQGA